MENQWIKLNLVNGDHAFIKPYMVHTVKVTSIGRKFVTILERGEYTSVEFTNDPEDVLYPEDNFECTP